MTTMAQLQRELMHSLIGKKVYFMGNKRPVTGIVMSYDGDGLIVDCEVRSEYIANNEPFFYTEEELFQYLKGFFLLPKDAEELNEVKQGTGKRKIVTDIELVEVVEDKGKDRGKSYL
jgi:hypothetical protein